MNLKQAEKLAWALINEHLYKVTGDNWDFMFDRSVRRFGCCSYRLKRITLSAALTKANDESAVRDTVLHEIAHALAGVGSGHGPKWREVALSIGCNGERTYSAATTVLPPLKWMVTCETCGYVRQYGRRRIVACGRCCRKFNGGMFTPKFAFRWKKNLG